MIGSECEWKQEVIAVAFVLFCFFACKRVQPYSTNQSRTHRKTIYQLHYVGMQCTHYIESFIVHKFLSSVLFAFFIAFLSAFFYVRYVSFMGYNPKLWSGCGYFSFCPKNIIFSIYSNAILEFSGLLSRLFLTNMMRNISIRRGQSDFIFAHIEY